MNVSENKSIAAKIIEDIFNGRAMENLPSLIAPGIVVHDTDKEIVGLEALRTGIANLHHAFPDLHYTIEDVMAENDKVTIRSIGTGTHKGSFRNIAPTGKTIRYTVILIWRFEDQRLAEHWSVSDVVGIFQQLGVTFNFPER